MLMMEMRLSEKIPPSWQEEGNLHQKLQKVWKPGVLRPKRSYQSQLQPPRLPNLHQHLRREGKHEPAGRPMTGAWHPCELTADPPLGINTLAGGD